MKLTISNLIMFLFLAILVSCENSNPIQNNNVDSIFQPDTITTTYNFNRIEQAALNGSWVLTNAIFSSKFGRLEHLEKYYEIQDTSKIMRINQNGINKTLFWREPYYSIGTFISEETDSLSFLFMSPSGGAPASVIHLDFTNKVLTLISSTTIKLRNSDEVYEGSTIEEYKKTTTLR